MRDIAVVPVKGLSDAKKRLSADLNVQDRRRFVLALLEDVLLALHSSNLFSEILVVSPDQSIDKEARLYDASFLLQNGSGLNAAAQQATRFAENEKASSLTTVLADIPLVESKDLGELFQISREKSRVVLSPSFRGGTNVMIRAPPDVITTAYGRWSFTKHLRMAQNQGLPVYSVSNPRLSFDIDTMEDLMALRQLDSVGRTTAGRLVREIGHVSPLARNA